MTNSSNEIGSQQAFPHSLTKRDAWGNLAVEATRGLTKRELFAVLCMQGAIAGDISGDDEMARRSVSRADALLAALMVSEKQS
jgi:hypothetical protein